MIFTERDYMEFCGFTYAFPYIPLQKMKHDTSFVKDPRILPLIHRFHMYVINFYWFCEDEASPSNVSTIQTLTVSLIKKCLAQTSRASLYKVFLPVLSMTFVQCTFAMARLLCQTPKCKLLGKRESWCCKKTQDS